MQVKYQVIMVSGNCDFVKRPQRELSGSGSAGGGGGGNGGRVSDRRGSGRQQPTTPPTIHAILLVRSDGAPRPATKSGGGGGGGGGGSDDNDWGYSEFGSSQLAAHRGGGEDSVGRIGLDLNNVEGPIEHAIVHVMTMAVHPVASALLALRGILPVIMLYPRCCK
jgi:hypothetical protein